MQDQSLGEMTISKVFELEQAMPLAMALPEVTEQDLARLRGWHTDPYLAATPEASQINLSVHSFIVRRRGRNILIDTCNGNHKTRSVPFAHQLDTPYLKRLAAAGLRPEDIDVVLCTHLHADHVGWNTRLRDGRWVPTFPKARYLFTRPDVEYLDRHRDEFLHGEGYTDSVLPVIEAGQASIVEMDHAVEVELGDGVWLEPAPGHSPGCCVVHARSRGARAVFSGDLFHHPVQLVRPSMPFFADFDPERAAGARTRIIETYADTDTRFFPAHFPEPTAGLIRSDGEGFAYRFL